MLYVAIIAVFPELTPRSLPPALGCGIPRKLLPGKLWQRFSVAAPAAGTSSSRDHVLS